LCGRRLGWRIDFIAVAIPGSQISGDFIRICQLRISASTGLNAVRPPAITDFDGAWLLS
jgi:hypothetical protein